MKKEREPEGIMDFAVNIDNSINNEYQTWSTSSFKGSAMDYWRVGAFTVMYELPYDFSACGDTPWIRQKILNFRKFLLSMPNIVFVDDKVAINERSFRVIITVQVSRSYFDKPPPPPEGWPDTGRWTEKDKAIRARSLIDLYYKVWDAKRKQETAVFRPEETSGE